MKRMLALAALLVVPLAFAQTGAVRICDADKPARCINLSSADGGSLSPTSYSLPTSPAGVRLDQAVVKKFSNCGATGSAAQLVPNGNYLMMVLDERTTVCLGATPALAGCDGGAGSDFPSSFGILVSFSAADGGQPVACMSAAGTGDVQFTLRK